MRFRGIGVIVLCLLAGWVYSAAELSVREGPPPAPLGWELHPTPGFNPSIESFLVDVSQNQIQPDRAPWQEWGASAVQAITGIYLDDRWAAFREYIARILVTDPSGKGKAFLNERVRGLLSPGHLKGKKQEFHDLANVLDSGLSDTVLSFVRESLKTVSEKAECSPEEMELAHEELWLLYGPRSSSVDAFFEQLAQQGNEALREMSIVRMSRIHPEKSAEYARKLLAETGDAERKMRLQVYLEESAAHTRAQEPMSKILDREHGKNN